MSERDDIWKSEKPKGLPRHSTTIMVVAAVISLALHVLSGVRLPVGIRIIPDALQNQDKDDEVKIRIVEKRPDEEMKKILEAKQEETATPEQADHLGQTDHIAEKETRVDSKLPRDKAADPGQAGPVTKKQLKQEKPPARPQTPQTAQTKTAIEPQTTVKSRIGTLNFGSSTKREKYEALLPRYDDMKHQLAEGYQDFVDEKIDEGDRIDINTKQYRYIGYMTGLRKAIELVWNYPLEASRRGIQGEVALEFHIQRDGQANRIKVVKSSGYDVLDDAIVEAIRLASPFSPLPDGINKKRLVITGSFHYVLNTFGSH